MQIELRQITKSYGSTRALDAFSATMGAGSMVAIIGLNGAGKSTLLNCLAGLVAPGRGEVRYNGETFVRRRLDLRRRLMFLPDFPPAWGEMNVLEHVSMLLGVYERSGEAATAGLLQALADFDLLPLAEMKLRQFSRGQLYKAALVGLVVVDPELWLLDEPFASGLDPQGIAASKQRARDRVQRGGTVVYSTQILEIAERFCDQLLVIDEGRLVSSFTRSELAAMPVEGPESLESKLRQFREVGAK